MKNLLAVAFLLLGLNACAEIEQNLPRDEPATFYWHNKKMTADTVPDITKAQDFLEQDLSACTLEVRDRLRWIAANDPVSTKDGHVVDEKGTPREYTDLPTNYELSQCMEKHGWVKLEHYYTIPY